MIRVLASAALAVALLAPVQAADAVHAADNGPLRPWLAPVSSPLPSQPPLLLQRAQLQAIARSAPEWLSRWGQTAPSIAWTEATLDLIVKYRQNPLRAARALVYVNVALHDALAACEAQRCSITAQRLAMHAAGGLMLEHLYPEEAPGRWQAQAASAAAAATAAWGTAPDAARAWRIGIDAAEAAIQRALYDGSDGEWSIHDRPAPGPSIWRAAPPLMAHNPVEATAPQWRTWVIERGSVIEWPTPPAFDGAQYQAEIDELLRLTRALTPEQKRIADTWNLDLGTVTPGGLWNRQAIALAQAHQMSMRGVARMLAAMNVAVFDAFVACWAGKLKYWTPRPITVIRDRIDASFEPYLVTPSFPAYPSGHSTVSGAASEVLAAFVAAERNALRLAAEEAAVSRLYGGIHVRSDNEAGLIVGRQIGAAVVKAALR